MSSDLILGVGERASSQHGRKYGVLSNQLGSKRFGAWRKRSRNGNEMQLSPPPNVC